jgi:alpha-mannosidase
MVDPKVEEVASAKQFFGVDVDNVVLDTVKVAEDPRSDGTSDIVVRFYEAMGGRGIVKFTT